MLTDCYKNDVLSDAFEPWLVRSCRATFSGVPVFRVVATRRILISSIVTLAAFACQQHNDVPPPAFVWQGDVADAAELRICDASTHCYDMHTVQGDVDATAVEGEQAVSEGHSSPRSEGDGIETDTVERELPSDSGVPSFPVPPTESTSPPAVSEQPPDVSKEINDGGGVELEPLIDSGMSSFPAPSTGSVPASVAPEQLPDASGETHDDRLTAVQPRQVMPCGSTTSAGPTCGEDTLNPDDGHGQNTSTIGADAESTSSIEATTNQTSDDAGHQCDAECTLDRCCDSGILPVSQCNDSGEFDAGCDIDGAPAPHCGNGIVEEGEDCDDADLTDVNGCGNDCQWSRGLTLWYDFDAGSGTSVVPIVGEQEATIRYGKRYLKAPLFDGAFVPSPGTQGGYLRLGRSAGVDPTDEDTMAPVQFAEMGTLIPNGTAATISVWFRRAVASSSKGVLLWLGSDGDGAAGAEFPSNDTFSPHHEIWMRHERQDPTQPTAFLLNVGLAASYALDVEEYEVPRPTPLPPETKCRAQVRLTYGDWHHVVLTLTNLQNPAGASIIDRVTEYSAYANGVRFAREEGCHSLNLARFRAAFLGRAEYHANELSWHGDVDNFMLFDRVLADEEVAALYREQLR